MSVHDPHSDHSAHPTVVVSCVVAGTVVGGVPVVVSAPVAAS